MKKNYKIIIAIATVPVLFILWYTISPLFIDIEVQDSAPIISQENITRDGIVQDQEFKNSITGTLGHYATGTVRVLRDGEKEIIRYENFETVNGPDLYVYLSNDLEAKDFVNLGRIKGTKGNINYEVPENISVSDYKYVMYWCKLFGVLFNYAELK